MRQIVVDTETTGLDPVQGHRIIEIGAVELIDRKYTGRTFHQYINPQRDIDEGALAVHGISREFLAEKPTFADIVVEFLDFIKDAELIIHNAPFDVGFFNYELNLITRGKITDYSTVMDTLILARTKHPGQKNNLDALCKRYQVDNSQREFHGALLDAEILADVFLAMTGGQTALMLETIEVKAQHQTLKLDTHRATKVRVPLKVIYADDTELAAHKAKIAALSKASGKVLTW